MVYLHLMIAVAAEVIGTSLLAASNGFSRLWPSIGTVLFYGIAFYFLSLPMRSMPVGVIYAIWSGVGIVLITMVGWFWFRQSLDWPAILGLALIVTGVLIVNLFSDAMRH